MIHSDEIMGMLRLPQPYIPIDLCGLSMQYVIVFSLWCLPLSLNMSREWLQGLYHVG